MTPPRRLSAFPCFVAIIAALLASPHAGAALRWEQTTAELTANAGDREVVAMFAFHNTGTTPVTIASIETSCACTTAVASPASVPPGGSGEVWATFTLGDRVGLQDKTVSVKTSAPDTPPEILHLRVDIRDVVLASPRLVRWRVGEPPVEKPVELRTAAGRQLTAVDPPDNFNVTTRLEVIDPGSRYRLWLKPVSTAHPHRLALHGTAHVVGRPPLPLYLYAVVQ